MLAKDNPQRVTLLEDRIKYWLSVGAQPSERVQGFLFKAGLVESALDVSHRPQKSRKKPDKKTRQELKAEAEAEAKAQAEEEAKAAAEAEAAPAEETSAEEAAAEDTSAQSA